MNEFLPPDPAQVLKAVEFWAATVDRQEYDLAAAVLAQPQWTADKLRSSVGETRNETPSRHDVKLTPAPERPELLGHVTYEWNALTATFTLVRREGVVMLELQELVRR